MSSTANVLMFALAELGVDYYIKESLRAEEELIT